MRRAVAAAEADGEGRETGLRQAAGGEVLEMAGCR